MKASKKFLSIAAGAGLGIFGVWLLLAVIANHFGVAGHP
ncbi:MAG: hypothetical protein HW398_393, partial [Acidobacteria bacterium]|nr:hypothetical protein [Acidobacteriota bacterium]